MSTISPPHPSADLSRFSFISTILFVLLLATLGAALAAAFAPVGKMMGANGHPWIIAYQKTWAAALMITAAIGLFFGVRLVAGKGANFRDIQVLGIVAVAFSLIAVVFGDWLNLAHRSQDGAQSFLLAKVHGTHSHVLGFTESITFFPLPLSVAAAFILLRYGKSLNWSPSLCASVAIPLVLVFFFLILAFGLGG